MLRSNYVLPAAAVVQQLFNDAGVPIEPFHLRRERQEGYFDADGNYIEYRLENITDPWLDSLEVRGRGWTLWDWANSRHRELKVLITVVAMERCFQGLDLFRQCYRRSCI